MQKLHKKTSDNHSLNPNKSSLIALVYGWLSNVGREQNNVAYFSKVFVADIYGLFISGRQ